MHVVAAPDKFRGTATAAEVTAAMAAAAGRLGASVTAVPMADGGEGTLAAFGGGTEITTVTGPLGAPVAAPWRYDPGPATAVIESAQACGLQLAGGPDLNDPEAATTRGVGELIAAAVHRGARRVLVGIGGSATTDGGQGAVDALVEAGLVAALHDVDVLVCCDVETLFLDAAHVFAPQKGADQATVARLSERLARRRDEYVARFGIDPQSFPGSGAAGGLAGGLAALGAKLVPGVDLIAAETGLDDAIAAADVVLTGEGRVDATSLQGKVVGALCDRARAAGKGAIVVAGVVDSGIRLPGVDVVSLTASFGAKRAFLDTARAIEDATVAALRRWKEAHHG